MLTTSVKMVRAYVIYSLTVVLVSNSYSLLPLQQHVHTHTCCTVHTVLIRDGEMVRKMGLLTLLGRDLSRLRHRGGST